jgi:hypothetical protein
MSRKVLWKRCGSAALSLLVKASPLVRATRAQPEPWEVWSCATTLPLVCGSSRGLTLVGGSGRRSTIGKDALEDASK